MGRLLFLARGPRGVGALRDVPDAIQEYRDGKISFDEMTARVKQQRAPAEPSPVLTAGALRRRQFRTAIPWIFVIVYDCVLAVAAVFVVRAGDSGYFGPVAVFMVFVLLLVLSGLPFAGSVSPLLGDRLAQSTVRSGTAVPALVVWVAFLAYVEWAQHRYCSYGKYPGCPDPGLPSLHTAFLLYGIDATIALIVFPLYIWFVHRRL